MERHEHQGQLPLDFAGAEVLHDSTPDHTEALGESADVVDITAGSVGSDEERQAAQDRETHPTYHQPGLTRGRADGFENVVSGRFKGLSKRERDIGVTVVKSIRDKYIPKKNPFDKQ